MFNSFIFILVYPVLFLLYYLIPSRFVTARNAFLLVASYTIYFYWNAGWPLALLLVTLITHVAAIVIDGRAKTWATHNRKWLIVIGIIFAVLPLAVIKYTDFILSTITSLFSNGETHLAGLNWAIPIGLSFFTFQAVGYVVDVYKKKIPAERNLLNYSLFVSFFPSIVAGPINRATSMLPQFRENNRRFDYDKVVSGMKMVLWGLLMKVVVADRLGMYVDTVMPQYMNYSGITCFLASVAYSMQIYADFAGYSLMAIGIGKSLSFDLAENFCRPYFSISITDFWHRWHISLSTWLRDYIYIPLGGSRCSKARNYFNILVTFLVSGLWHGANWTFVLWGGIHGAAQVVEKWLGLQKSQRKGLGRLLRITVTFIVVNFAWVFFKMSSVSDAVSCIGRMFTAGGGVFYSSQLDYCFVGLAMLILKDIADEFYPSRFKFFDNRYIVVRWVSYLFVLLIIMLSGVFTQGNFIYANF
ncbi:MAG: MBOAT family protein [Muribaculaceae bacterium]|nr:MBOAT family protein [Muribaculaceae bacterium]